MYHNAEIQDITERRHLVCNHNNGDPFASEDNMSFSSAKIPIFRAKVQLAFMQ